MDAPTGVTETEAGAVAWAKRSLNLIACSFTASLASVSAATSTGSLSVFSPFKVQSA